MKKYFRSIINWLDSHQAVGGSQTGIDWPRIIPFIAIHLGCLAVLWVGVSLTAVIAAIFFYAFRIFCIGAFYHRYFSHKSFKTSRAWQFVFAVLTMTSIQRGPLWWAAHHREHHLHADDELDPHSPKHGGFLWSHMGWFLAKKNFHFNQRRIQDFAAYPELVFIDRFDALVPVLFGLGIFGLGTLLNTYFPALQTSGSQLFVWVFCISTVCVYHATFCINSLAHTVGKKVYPGNDTSRNNWLLAIFTFGEGWHNNHHRYPISARQGFKWWEIDITYYILKLLSKVGVVSDLKVPPAHFAKS